ncbi:Hypothetical protein NTJ_09666 [Nesidiocoris tenuis]|uniref:Fibrinogen C-terminal domain-containing protein n=1 Tax=Nesidiocoris tenuis TaxID=355587 RepID=A0ABN7AXF9_9HEMI|nr:Hypothetical protein NTJ_09666 [Nesidiocoris tenuis]
MMFSGINDRSTELRENVLDEDLKVDKSHVSGFGGFRVRNSKREALNDEGNDYSADYQGYFRLSSGKSPTSYIMLAFSRGRTNQADGYADKDFPNADGAWKFKQQLSR